jgi:hypothetical protein
MTTIECIGPAFTYRWPGGEVHLEPGKPIDLPDERAQRLLSKAPGKVRIVTATFQAGAQITWTRGDGTTHTGVVDLIYTDDTGTRWAFVTLGGSWAAVNMKFVTGRA